MRASDAALSLVLQRRGTDEFLQAPLGAAEVSAARQDPATSVRTGVADGEVYRVVAVYAGEALDELERVFGVTGAGEGS